MNIKVTGVFDLVLTNPDGSVAWKGTVKNGIVNAGLNAMGSVTFSSGTQITSWFAGLINSTSFSSLSVNDTMSSHAGWFEFTGYSGLRPLWVNATAGQQTASSGSFSFNITANAIIQGIFIVGSGSTPGGTTGTLWCTAQLPSLVSANIGQTLTGQYTVQYAGG